VLSKWLPHPWSPAHLGEQVTSALSNRTGGVPVATLADVDQLIVMGGLEYGAR
jgi:hypothetical protein